MYLTITQSNNLNFSRLKIIQKIYVWSLIFEPLLFFLKASGGLSTGIPISISRILQFIVIFYFLFISNEFKNHLIKNKTLPFYISKYFGYYITISLFSTFFGLFIFNSYEFVIGSNYENNLPFFKKPFIRVFLELFLIFYYYFYFVVLSRVIFNSINSLNYFFNYFIKSLLIIIILGFVDLSFAYMGFDLISRHFGEITDVGTRWHSVLGEPRDAFVYILYAVLLYTIYSYLNNTKGYKVLFFLFVSLVLTQSFSGLIGLFIGISIFMFYLLMKRKKIILFAFFTLIIFTLLTLRLTEYSDRIQLYIESSYNLISLLESGYDLPPVVKTQVPNLFPLFELYNDFINLNFFQILIGYGVSTSSIINFSYLGEFGYPNAQFIRIFYESGFIGQVFYIMFLIYPCLNFIDNFSKKKKYILIFILFIVTGSGLAHRSLIPFIMVGIFLALNNFKNKLNFN